MNSRLKDKINIGNHNIECTGAIREARYRETKTGKYDGIHLYGSSGCKAYTLSVVNILKNAQLTSSEYEYHQSCAQHKYQNGYRQSRHNVYKQKVNRVNIRNVHSQREGRNVYHQQAVFSLPTKNRFDSLSGLNQGNW